MRDGVDVPAERVELLYRCVRESPHVSGAIRALTSLIDFDGLSVVGGSSELVSSSLRERVAPWLRAVAIDLLACGSSPLAIARENVEPTREYVEIAGEHALDAVSVPAPVSPHHSRVAARVGFDEFGRVVLEYKSRDDPDREIEAIGGRDGGWTAKGECDSPTCRVVHKWMELNETVAHRRTVTTNLAVPSVYQTYRPPEGLQTNETFQFLLAEGALNNDPTAGVTVPIKRGASVARSVASADQIRKHCVAGHVVDPVAGHKILETNANLASASAEPSLPYLEAQDAEFARDVSLAFGVPLSVVSRRDSARNVAAAEIDFATLVDGATSLRDDLLGALRVFSRIAYGFEVAYDLRVRARVSPAELREGLALGYVPIETFLTQYATTTGISRLSLRVPSRASKRARRATSDDSSSSDEAGDPIRGSVRRRRARDVASPRLRDARRAGVDEKLDS